MILNSKYLVFSFHYKTIRNGGSCYEKYNTKQPSDEIHK